MAMYQDLDFSFRLDSKGDFALLEDANAIKASIYNRLLISNPELYFVDGQRIVVTDFLFDDDDFLTRGSIRDTINNVIDTDERIAGLDALIINFNGDENRYEISLSFTLKTNTMRSTEDRQVDITLFLNRQ